MHICAVVNYIWADLEVLSNVCVCVRVNKSMVYSYLIAVMCCFACSWKEPLGGGNNLHRCLSPASVVSMNIFSQWPLHQVHINTKQKWTNWKIHQDVFFGDMILFSSINSQGSFQDAKHQSEKGSQPTQAQVCLEIVFECEWWNVIRWSMEFCYLILVCYCVAQVDPKFLRNMRFAKKHNVKHQKQKVWVECTVSLTCYSCTETDKCVLCIQRCIHVDTYGSFMIKWLNCTFLMHLIYFTGRCYASTY